MKNLINRAHINTYHILRKSEKYFKTDMVYLAKGGAWSMSSSIVSLLLSTATFLAFANLLPKLSYGTYQYILSVVDILGIFVLSGIDTAVARSTALGKEGSLMTGLFAKIRWGLIGGAMSIILGVYYLSNGNIVLGWGFIIAGFFIPFWEAPGIYGNYLQGKKRFDILSITEVITQLCLAFILIPTLFLTNNVLLILFLYLLTLGVTRTGFLFFSLWKFPPNNEVDPDITHYGKHLTMMSVMNTVASNADKILLWHLLGPVPVAVYTLSQSIPARANGFLKIINRIAFPKMATQEPEKLRQTLMRKVLLVVLVSTLCALVYAGIAPLIFKFFLPQYIEAVPYTILAAALIALQPFSLISSFFSAQARKKPLYIGSIIVPIIRIFLFIILIPLFGLWGAMIALVATKVFESALLTILFYRM